MAQGAAFKIFAVIPIMISAVFAVTGFYVIKEIFDRIASVSQAARMIAQGKQVSPIEIERVDEVGDLGDAINLLTQRIRSNMDELKGYGEKTTEINIEIQKRLIALSSLLQISSLISENVRLEDVLKIITEKARLIADSDASYLLFREEGWENFYMKAADGRFMQQLLKVNVEPKDILFGRSVEGNRPAIVDRQNTLSENLFGAFYEKFRVKNTLALPVHIRGKVIALLGIGNNLDQYVYKKEDIELLDVFAKQLGIAIEGYTLMRRVEKLEIKDALTGLYNEAFIHNRLQEEIKRAIAYQRPCGFILFDIDNFKTYNQNFGLLEAEAALKKIGLLIRDSISEIDRVGRIGDDEFAIILPEKNKRQAQKIAEDIRQKIEFSYSEEPDVQKKITICGGVTENPLDGVDVQELISKAKELVNVAKKQGKNRIISFKEPPVCR